MTDLQVSVAEDQITLTGDINYKTVVSALNVKIFLVNKAITVDFSGVGHADSSGLALMVHWLREAKKQNLLIHFKNIPQKLIALAEMSNLEEVLPIS